MTSETDTEGNAKQYEYDTMGRLVAVWYDNTGSLLTQNVGDGRTVSSSYNELGMVTKVTSAEGTIVYQYNGQGYLVSVTNVNGDVVSMVTKRP